MTLGRTGGGGTLRSPKVDVQLKCTADAGVSADGLHLRLKRKNYDDLRTPADNLQVPRLLVVVRVPADVADWVGFGDGPAMLLRQDAWYLNLEGMPDRPDVDGPTVVLPPTQRLDPAALATIMEAAGGKKRP